MTKRGPVGQPEEGDRRKRNRGPVGTIGKDSRSTVSKALGDAIVQEHGSSSEDALDMFLPGIFNDITVAHIVPKLCWKDTLSLSSVSRTWLHGIRSCQVRCSTESFVVLPYYRPKVHAEIPESRETISIALYSMKEDRSYELPPLPPFAAPLPGVYWFTSVLLDCKVYVMEVHTSFRHWRSPTVTSRMLAFDVLGQGGWQPCANLQRTNFKCGVLNGKIYAVGGCDKYRTGHDSSTGTSEVYNPKDNTWSWIKPLKRSGVGEAHQVWVLGDKLVVRHEATDRVLRHGRKHENFDVYDPTKDDWTEVELPRSVVELPRSVVDAWGVLGVNNMERVFREFSATDGEMFTTHGKFYIMDESKIYIYDSEKGLWKCLHASSFTGIGMGRGSSFTVFPMHVLVVDDEIVAIVDVEQSDFPRTTILLRSKSHLGGENREIVWQRARTDILNELGDMGQNVFRTFPSGDRDYFPLWS
ncbi:unnamed protein product [Calypogeia fissa]